MQPTSSSKPQNSNSLEPSKRASKRQKSEDSQRGRSHLSNLNSCLHRLICTFLPSYDIIQLARSASPFKLPAIMPLDRSDALTEVLASKDWNKDNLPASWKQVLVQNGPHVRVVVCNKNGSVQRRYIAGSMRRAPDRIRDKINYFAVEVIVQSFPRLDTLNLRDTEIENKTLQLLANTNIRDLDVSNCSQLSSEGFGHLKKLPLQILNLTGTRISMAGLKELADCPIHTLHLSHCAEVLSRALQAIVKLPLRYLNISNTRVDDEGLQYLKGMKLTHLDVSQCASITERSMEIIKAFPLESLDMSETRINTVSLLDLQGMPLQHLTMRKCPLITHIGRQEMSILKTLPLKTLHSSDVTDQGVEELANSQIEELSLCGSDHVTDDSLSYLKNLPLRYLDLASTKVTDKGVAELEGIPLQILYLSNCRVTDACIPTLLKLPLKHLNVVKTDLTENGLQELRRKENGPKVYPETFVQNLL